VNLDPPEGWTEWRRRARRQLPRFAFDYLEGGAEDETCMQRNLGALARACLVPERLTDVSTISLETSLLGKRIDMPVVIAPTGFNDLFWPAGDASLARAAAHHNIPFSLSTASNASLEEIATIPNSTAWFQLYVLADRSITEHLLTRAHQAQYGALVVTVDVPVPGMRFRDRRNHLTLPFKLRHSFGQLLVRPRWCLRMARAGAPTLINLSNELSSRTACEQLARREMDRTFSWRSLDWIRQFWTGPLLLKGILSPHDVARAREAGVDGIIVSNHGGRQLDSAPATIDMLALIAQQAAGMTLLVDSGFRSASDILKAIALGAHGVLLGRLPLYGLAACGELGARSVLARLRHDLINTLALLGVPSVSELTSRHVVGIGELTLDPAYLRIKASFRGLSDGR
jgi:(S)-mandelate dehydrogenase